MTVPISGSRGDQVLRIVAWVIVGIVVTPLNVSFSVRLVMKRYKILSIMNKMSENNMT